MNTNKELTGAIERWWNDHPFTYGAGKEDYRTYDLVGGRSLEDMDLAYFETVERRFRKLNRVVGQHDGAPLLSNVISYEKLKGKDVLDIAIGSGVTFVEFLRQGARGIGIDLTDVAVTQTKKNLSLRGLLGTVQKMDAQHMTFPNDSFDFVNAWGCLMHMPDTEGAIKEIYRVLRKNGSCLAYLYNRNSWSFWFNYVFVRGVLLGGLIRYRGDIDRLTSRYTDGASQGGNMLAKFFSPRTVARMFEAAGFTHVHVRTWDQPGAPDLWPMRSFPVFRYLPKRVKAYLSKHLAYGMIVTADKL